ncbi:MAG: flavin reductase family protein [Hyphomicrobiales bacterium]|nr:flavin reductase family protein [Hyphomicrobiales bacterium]
MDSLAGWHEADRSDADGSDADGSETLTIKPSILYFGTPVVLITTLNPDATVNISPMSSAWALGDRVVLGCTASGQGIENLRRERECVLNFPSPKLWRNVERIARATGKHDVPPEKAAIGYEFVADKFALAKLAPTPSETVEPPRIAECPLQFEAELVEARPSNGADGRTAFFIAETRVKRVHAHRDVVVEGTNHIDPARWEPLLYVFRHYFGTGTDLGKTFKAEC